MPDSHVMSNPLAPLASTILYKTSASCSAVSSSFLFSLALFAYWLRSSVVSVLFSLISERLSPTITLIIPIFVFREGASGLAHVPPHRVSGITLPPDDATPFFIARLTCKAVKKKILRSSIIKLS